MQGEEKTDDGRDEDGSASKVKLADTVHESQVDAVGAVAVDMDEEEDDDHGEATDGKVDVEAPSPGGMLGEGTTKKRTSNGSNTPHAANKTKGKRSLLKRHDERQDDDGTREKTSRTNSCNSSSNDKGNRRGRNGRDQATNLKDEDSDKIGNLDIEVLVDGSVHGLQSRGGEKVRGTIPSNILDTLELGSDGSKSGCDNGLVQSNEEDGETEG